MFLYWYSAAVISQHVRFVCSIEQPLRLNCSSKYIGNSAESFLGVDSLLSRDRASLVDGMRFWHGFLIEVAENVQSWYRSIWRATNNPSFEFGVSDRVTITKRVHSRIIPEWIEAFSQRISLTMYLFQQPEIYIWKSECDWQILCQTNVHAFPPNAQSAPADDSKENVGYLEKCQIVVMAMASIGAFNEICLSLPLDQLWRIANHKVLGLCHCDEETW